MTSYTVQNGSVAFLYNNQVRTDLAATLAVPAKVPAYVEAFWHRLQAEGIGQPDLHPATRGLGKATARAIRGYNADRRGETDDEQYGSYPVKDWKALPRQFAGYRLTDIKKGQEGRVVIYRLQPFTELDRYTELGDHPGSFGSYFETYRAWGRIIKRWAERQCRALMNEEEQVWAFLIGHDLRLPGLPDGRMDGTVIRSPWRRGSLVRLEIEPEFDDVPY